ncbi:MAG: hypothetical protein LBH66_01920 [Oscillospiraceae bacterium]|nr:hypothetical protein [Oscillospiraceae bacterium]
MDETLAVLALGLTGSLYLTLSTTNPVESANAGCRRTTARVANVQDGAMAIRHAAAGFMMAEHGFHRVSGFKQLPNLYEALTRIVNTRLSSGLVA